MIPVGISISANYFVGTYIGMGLPTQAKKFSSLCNIFANMWAFLTIFVIYMYEKEIMSFYTKDSSMKKVMDNAWSMLIVFIYFDCMQAVANANIMGLGLV